MAALAAARDAGEGAGEAEEAVLDTHEGLVRLTRAHIGQLSRARVPQRTVPDDMRVETLKMLQRAVAAALRELPANTLILSLAARESEGQRE